jgi:cardiolipin synthase A/B
VRAPPARYAWPAGLAVWGALLYGSETLRHRRDKGSGYDLEQPIDVASPEFLHACEALTGAPVSEGNEVELLINGDRIFPAYLDVIDGAEKTVNLETYVWWRGGIASTVAEHLCAKAKQGVEVRVVVDWVGTQRMESHLLQEMEDSGVHVARFRALRPWSLRRLNNRTHRKLLIADGRVAMTGGVGIAEEWEGDAQDPDHWRDTHVRVRGPVVRSVQGAFAEHWLEATGEVLVGPDDLPKLEPIADGGPMQLVRSRAAVGDTNVEALYFLAIASARVTLDLTAAYFAPRPAFVKALCEASQRGVRVRVLVPGPHIDKEFVRIAGHAAYEELLGCGVEVWEYGPTMLHAKTLCIDGAWSSVGSVNFDNRSFQLQDEATLCVQSTAFAERLTEQFERDLAVSERYDRERFAERSRYQRALERAMALGRREL